MKHDPELDDLARETINGQSELGYTLYIDPYSGMVSSGLWEPYVGVTSVGDAEKPHDILTLLENCAGSRGRTLTPDEAWEVVETIGRLLRSPPDE